MSRFNLNNPIYIEKYKIYDILHNDIDQIIIIVPGEIKTLNIELCKNDKLIKFNCILCPDNNPSRSKITASIYVCSNQIYENEICLLINNEKFLTNVNKYPCYKDEIIMSTMVKNEDDYIIQWIKYHLVLGIKRFIIYDNTGSINTRYYSNKKTSNLSLLLNDFIKDGTVLLIKWIYPKYLENTGNSGQTTQQNHSVYTFNTSKYIGLLDIDEYINPQTEIINLNDIFSNQLKINNINYDSLGGWHIICKLFYNQNNLIDNSYNFFKIFTCSECILNAGRRKLFVIPKNINTVSIHNITSGKKTIQININTLFFNHYFFLNKSYRNNEKGYFIDDSITRIVDLIK